MKSTRTESLLIVTNTFVIAAMVEGGCGPEIEVPAESTGGTGIVIGSSSDTGAAGSSGYSCEVDVLSVWELCALDTSQDTLVTVTGEGTEFVGTHAFYGPHGCRLCLSVSRFDVHIFAERPVVDGGLGLESKEGAQLWLHSVRPNAGAGELELEQASYYDPAAGWLPLDSVTISLIDAPELEDFEPPVVDSNLPHLRFDLEAAGSGLQVSGVVDAVFCGAAGYVPPCE